MLRAPAPAPAARAAGACWRAGRTRRGRGAAQSYLAEHAELAYGWRHYVTWAQRTPQHAPPVAHELAAALDDRARALGERLAASPEPWLARQLGVLAQHASPLLREEYARPAAAAAAYREAAGITDLEQAIAAERTRGNPNLKRCAGPRAGPWKYATRPTSSGG